VGSLPIAQIVEQPSQFPSESDERQLLPWSIVEPRRTAAEECRRARAAEPLSAARATGAGGMLPALAAAVVTGGALPRAESM
jgi:hypothetical protein